jgi:hypothetical protein
MDEINKKNKEEEEEEEAKEERYKKWVEEMVSDLRKLAYEGELKLMIKLIPIAARHLVSREEEILQILLIGMIMWRLREKINGEKEITAYEFKTMFESIKDVMEKINEKKKEIEKEQQQIKKPKYPTGLFGMKIKVVGNRFVIEEDGEENMKNVQ